MRKIDIQKGILGKLTRDEIIDKNIQLMNTNEKQSLEINNLIKKLKKYKEEIEELNKSLKSLTSNSKQRKTLQHYEDMIRDYRLEISDLKDEIEEWRVRYINKK